MTVDSNDEHLERFLGGMSGATAKRVGYSVMILIYIVSIWVIYNLLDWGWPPFLTEEWNDAIPYLVTAIVISLILTLPLFWYDPPWYKSTKEIITNLASIAVTIAVWRIWPFAFSDGGFPWETVVRIALIIGIAGPILGIISETVKLVRRLQFDSDPDIPRLDPE
ncbi:MAG: hypothetical protein ABFR95_05605 [Actinomycetota bacterium]